MKASIVFTFALLAAGALSDRATSAQSPMPTGLARVSLGAKQRFDLSKRDILDSAEAVPESEYSFRPTAQVRTFGELVGHAADVNTLYCGLASGANPEWKDTAEKTAKTKADVIKALKEIAKCDDVFAKTNAENALSLVPAGQRDQMRVMVLLDDVSHLNEHYGNIVTYMRIKGHVPPSTLREQRGSGH
jgi:uncharacterized damage-inducible protein DinB